MLMANDDRLGDAIRELAAGLVENGRGSCRFTVGLPDTVAKFELRLVSVTANRKRSPHSIDGVIAVERGL